LVFPGGFELPIEDKMQKIADQPWIALVLVVVLGLLWLGALRRIRRDRILRHRAKVDRRNKARAERDRRWKARS